MTEKVISERVVSQKVIGSANPLAKKIRNLKSAISGACMAPIIILVALGILYYGETFKRDSAIVSTLELQQANEVSGENGLHKITDKPTILESVNAPEVGEVLYYSSKIEHFEEATETRRETTTEVIDGKEVEKVVEKEVLVEKWVEEESSSEWAEFKLGDIEIRTSGAETKLNTKKAEYWEDLFGDFEKLDSATTKTPKLGDRRLVVTYLEVNEDIIAIGDISNDKLSNGDIFMITNKTDSELIEGLENSESTIYWVTKVVAWFMLSAGFTSIVGPMLALTDFIPLVGGMARSVAGFISAVTAFLIVVMVSILIKFWWLFIILMILLLTGMVGLFLYLQGKKEGKK